MTKKQAFSEELPLYISRSDSSTETNQTGSWRYFRPLYQEKTAPCSAACPVGEDIPRVEMMAARGLLKEALVTILDENPFPSVCGRVCFHPCENSCNRGQLDEPIAIHKLERFLGDRAVSDDKMPAREVLCANAKKVAIVGAGPAGLATGYFLSRLGYRCDIFEAQDEPGGILRWGIPGYRLPEDILKKEINRIQTEGVKIYCQTPVTAEFLAKIKDRYDALFIGCGYGRPIELKIPGEDWVHDGLKFLYQNRAGNLISLQGIAAVIGGGNTAVDVARSVARLGATSIIVYRRRRQDMPAFEPEVEIALQEGIELRELAAPIRIEKDHRASSRPDFVYTLTLQKMKISAERIGGRARVIPDGNKTATLRVQHIFRAIGAEPENFWVRPSKNLKRQLTLSHCKLIEQDLPVVFGGDLTNETKSVTDSIASGKQAAIALDIYFKKGWDAIAGGLLNCRIGTGLALSMAAYLGQDRISRKSQVVTLAEINTDYFQSARRVLPPRLSPRQSIRSFSEIESTLSEGDANQEAERCFNCGICNACDYCRIFCPEVAVIVEKERRYINLQYCKGCGICVTECPRDAMALEEEKT